MRSAIAAWILVALSLGLGLFVNECWPADSPGNPGTAQAYGASKQGDDLKEIATRAIEASQNDVEVIKWIFIAISAVFTLVGISAGVFNYLQLSEALKKLESFGVEQASQLSDLRTVLSEGIASSGELRHESKTTSKCPSRPVRSRKATRSG